MKVGDEIVDSPKNDSRIPVRYVIIESKSLGDGAFGEVYLVEKKSENAEDKGNPLAMKRIKKDDVINDKDKLHRILTEIKIHRSLNNQYICKFEHSFEDKYYIYILMEYCKNGSLNDILKDRKTTLSEYETRFYMYQVVLGLVYLKKQKVIHRDLTLANIFLKDYKTVKIGDFGLSYKENENEERHELICGTEGYFTPESHEPKYSYKTDIFDLGVCIYHLMTGKTLFKDSATCSEIIKRGEVKFDEKTKFSSEALDLLRRIFVLENKRIDLDEILIHDFFNEGKGLKDVDFPDYDALNDKIKYNEKIKALEKGVKMTNVSYYFPYMNKKSNSIDETIQDSNNNRAIQHTGSDSLRNNVISNKKINDLNRTKFSLNGDFSEINDVPIAKSSNNISSFSKKFRRSIKAKETNDETSPLRKFKKKKGNNKNSVVFVDDKNKKEKEKEKEKEKDNDIENEEQKDLKDKDDDIKNKDIFRKKLELNLEKIKKENNIESKLVFDNRGTFRPKECQDMSNLNSIKEEKNTNKDKESDEEKEQEEKEKEKEEKKIEKKNAKDGVYIKHVIEINEKYGIGYELSNKDIGVLFNDSTNITKFKTHKHVIFYVFNGKTRKIKLPLYNERNEDLLKKVYYLGNIIEEAKKKQSKEKSNEENNNLNIHDFLKNHNNLFESKKTNVKNIEEYDEENVYLIKYKRSAYALFFILSNKIIQISFFDGTNVIFSYSKNKKIIYINKHGEITNFELQDNEDFTAFKCEDHKINKRIKYALRELRK